ncbi:choice-of-anchor I family protein [Paenibacillus sp. NPDC058071]|uniref:choice-of-anchor I family protein n=1 Tax=Paenibacillus sp. NPDC058071 TaxID=3346326 RepID=UPI0036DEA38E
MKSTVKKTTAVLLAAQLALGTFAGSIVTAAPGPDLTAGTPYLPNGQYNTDVPHILIHQVYGSGLTSASDAFSSHGFIELFNPTDSDIDLSGWALHYADRGNKEKTGPTGDWQKLNLQGEIKAKSSYLVRARATGTVGARVDLTSKKDLDWDTRFINNKGMKVVLTSNQLDISNQVKNPFETMVPGYVDMIGTGSNDEGSDIDGYESDYPTGSAEGTSKKKSIRRVDFKDTDHNKADFKQVDYEAVTNAELAVLSPKAGSDGAWAVQPDPLAIQTASLPNAYTDQAYQTSIVAKGGKAPYTYEANGLPQGLSMTTDGVISGTPRTAETGVKVNVTVTDSTYPTAWTASQSLTLNVQAFRPNIDDTLAITKIGGYSVGSTNADGGVAEIVKFNKDNGKFYLVNGSANPPTLDIVSLGNGKGDLQKEKSVFVRDLAETNGSFTFGDLTSVDVNTATKRIYVAVQENDRKKAGKILALDYSGNLVTEYAAGVQPDMIKSTPDGRYVMTADEAEPNNGVDDPPGSVTIVDTQLGTSVQVYFDDESVISDNVHIRGAVDPADGMIKGKGTKADAYYDLEPEYIALSADYKKAYVSLQENNAIATIDIASKKVLSVDGLGFKDFNAAANALDVREDGAVLLENVPFKGVYMPDGIATHQINGKTYLFTANEGDATEWPNRVNISTIGKLKGQLDPASEAYAFLNGKDQYNAVEVLADMGNDGIYMLGGRSFSIWDTDTMEQVYDSGNDFETITGQRLPAFFNASHSKVAIDDRSTKKGPEPEDIKTGEVGNHVFAFVGLERVGGIMTYDVTDPASPAFVNYTNTREFLNSQGKVNLDTDTGPEGLEFISAADSPTGLPLLLVAFEVGGKVAVYQLETTKVTLDRTALSLAAGGTSTKLNAVVEPIKGGAATVTWSSSDASVAAVDADGTVRPLKEGKTVIKAISSDGYGSAEAVVTVAAAPGGGGTPTPTPTPSATPTPTPSPGSTPTPTPSSTPGSGSTPTPSTPAPSATPKPTATPSTTPAPTQSPVPSSTPKPTASPGQGGSSFTDVNGHWAKDAIGKLAAAGILQGQPDGSFKPDNRMTRAEYMAVLYRLIGLQGSTAPGSGFKDVPAGAWYSVYVNALTSEGIAGGFSDGSFRPNKELTREEAFVLLYRAVKDQLPSGGSKQPFTDNGDISGWAREAIEALAQAGIIQGGSDGKLNPKKTITRAEIAKIAAYFVK